MKARFKMISSILIILLTCLLIYILISYYLQPVEVTKPDVDNLASANQELNKVISENISGEKNADSTVIVSGDGVYVDSGENGTTVNKNTDVLESSKPQVEIRENDKAVIITSEDTMTNKEKREILTELDNTLMDLLDVVNKVQTVDESRLVTSSEGEVQE